jgi:hypothetical protein
MLFVAGEVLHPLEQLQQSLNCPPVAYSKMFYGLRKVARSPKTMYNSTFCFVAQSEIRSDAGRVYCISSCISSG